MVYEQGHILESLAQRRDFDRDDRQSVIKIFPERAVTDFRLERLVRRTDHPNINRHALVVADPPHFPLLQDTEELGLKRSRHRVHLIEENRTEIGFFEEPAFVRHCPGEGALFVPEQL
jgi:hypothetical protein